MKSRALLNVRNKRAIHDKLVRNPTVQDICLSGEIDDPFEGEGQVEGRAGGQVH